MKTLITLLVLTSRVWAGAIPVVDYSHILQDASHQVVNVAHFAATELNTLRTYEETLRTYEQEVIQVAQIGNSGLITKLPGMQVVGQLYGDYQSVRGVYSNFTSLSNPTAFQTTMSGIMTGYRLPSFQNLQLPDGRIVAPNQGTFQFDTAQWKIAQAAQAQLQQLDNRLQQLQQTRDQDYNSLALSGNLAGTTKWGHTLAADDAAISQVSEQAQQLYQRVQLQNQQQQAGQRIFMNQSAATRQLNDAAAIDQGMYQLPTGSFKTPVLWGSQL